MFQFRSRTELEYHWSLFFLVKKTYLMIITNHKRRLLQTGCNMSALTLFGECFGQLGSHVGFLEVVMYADRSVLSSGPT